MILNAYAKINLTLDIIEKRPDGFHELESVMLPVSLCDTVEILESDAFSFECSKKELEGIDNLCVRAANAYIAATGITKNVCIKLTKNIPVAAGLGGGSSDAAAVLRGMNDMFGALSEERLFEIAASLGSDVPFCLLSKCAVCTGRGEKMTPIAFPTKFCFVIAIGNGNISTKQAYDTFDSMGTVSGRYTKGLLSALASNEINPCRFFGNDFDTVCRAMCPDTVMLLDDILSSGAVVSQVSGSGPSAFGVFDSKETAVSAAVQLTKKGYTAFFAEQMN